MKENHTMKEVGNDGETVGKHEELFRAASLVSIGIGAAIFGAGADPFASLDLPMSIFVIASLFVAALGITLGGLKGMGLFVLGSVLFGSSIIGGSIPTWLFALGVPILVPGIAYRIFRPD